MDFSRITPFLGSEQRVGLKESRNFQCRNSLEITQKLFAGQGKMSDSYWWAVALLSLWVMWSVSAKAKRNWVQVTATVWSNPSLHVPAAPAIQREAMPVFWGQGVVFRTQCWVLWGRQGECISLYIREMYLPVSDPEGADSCQSQAIPFMGLQIPDTPWCLKCILNRVCHAAHLSSLPVSQMEFDLKLSTFFFKGRYKMSTATWFVGAKLTLDEWV